MEKFKNCGYQPNAKNECEFRIGDTVYTWDFITEKFIKIKIFAIHKELKEIKINGLYDADECFSDLHDAYMYECKLATNKYHDELREISESYFKLEKEVKENAR